MLRRCILILLVGLLAIAPSMALYARQLAIIVQQQTGRELKPANSSQTEEERSEHSSGIPSRREGIERSLASRFLHRSSSTSDGLRRSPNARLSNHEANLGEHAARNGCGAPLLR